MNDHHNLILKVLQIKPSIVIVSPNHNAKTWKQIFPNPGILIQVAGEYFLTCIFYFSHNRHFDYFTCYETVGEKYTLQS